MSLSAAAMALAVVANAALVDRSVGCQPEPLVCEAYWKNRAFLDPQKTPPPQGMVAGARSMLYGFAYKWHLRPLDGCAPARGEFERAGGVWVMPGRTFWFEFDRVEPLTHCRMMSDKASD